MKKYVHHFKKLRAQYTYLDYFILGALFILTCYICFYKLGNAYLDDWDEAWYGEMAKQIMQTGKFLVLQWNRDYLFDKPPLYIWITAVLGMIFGLNEWTVRITSAISGLVVISGATYFMYRKWGIVPAIVGYCALAFNNIYIWRVRSGNLDSLLTLLIFTTFFVMISRWKWRYLVIGFLLALIFLTKASVVAFPFVIFIGYEILYNTKRVLKNIPFYIAGLLIYVLIVYGWLYLGKAEAGNEFMDYYLNHSDQGVADISMEKFKTDYIQYTYYSLQRRFFFVMLLGTAAAFIFKWKKGEYFLMVAFSYLLLALLSFTQRNNNWYLTPSIPFWSLLVGYGTYVFTNTFKQFKIPLSLAVLLLSFYISYKTFTGHIIPIIHTSSSTKQTEAAMKAKELTQKNETIVRMDHLYPSTIFYSDRHVLASPSSSSDSKLFISRQTLAERIQKNELRWLVGRNGDVESFVKEYEIQGEFIIVNDEEKIFKTSTVTSQED